MPLPAVRKITLALSAVGPGLFLIGYNIGTGSVTTMAKTGAEHGMQLLWALVLSCVFTYFLMVAYGQVTLVTGQTALRAIQRWFSSFYLGKILAVYILVALILGELLALMGIMGIVADLLQEGFRIAFDIQVSTLLITAVLATAIYALLWNGTYVVFEKLLIGFVILMGLCFFVVFLKVRPEWSTIVQGLVPSIPKVDGAFGLIAAIAGTTCSAAVFVMRSTVVAEKGWDINHLKNEKRDAFVSAAAMLFLSAVIMAVGAGTLFVTQPDQPLQETVDLIRLFEPLGGKAAALILILGIAGAGLSTLFPIVLIAPWLVCDFQGWPRNLRSPLFRVLGLLGVLFCFGMQFMDQRPIVLMVFSQAFQACILPAVAIPILVLINRTDVMGKHRAGWMLNSGLLGASIFAIVTSYLALLGTATPPSESENADIILCHGKIVTVDDQFSIHQAIAVRGGKILHVGSDEEVLAKQGPDTEVIDLAGKMVLPGLIDSHVHPSWASMHEFDHEVPEMESIADVLDYIRARAKVVEEGDWIWIQQVFITRLREQRYPTRAELDEAAPKHAVVFSTGPDASASSLALSKSGIDKNFKFTGSGSIEKNPQTGDPTGILRGNTKRYLQDDSPEPHVSEADRAMRLQMLLKDYNSVGITAIGDRDASDADVARYYQLHKQGKLTVRTAISLGIDPGPDLDVIREEILHVAQHPLRQGDPTLRIIGVKTYQDGGMLTGSAYMLEPWGLSKIYSITDPRYRGVLFIPKEKLLEIVRLTIENDLQFTAHSVGDGAVTNLVDIYEEISKEMPIRKTRPCITHCNFMTLDCIERMAKLGIAADMQPAWLYLDAPTLTEQFGYKRLQYFQPMRSLFEQGVLVGGGSDHMQKIGSLRSINPYNPFLGMWVTLTRRSRWSDTQLHPEEAITREQAIRFYTKNNATLLFLDQATGSLEPGKLADLIVLDRDIMECEVDAIQETQVLSTYVGGKLVYSQNN